MQKEERSWTVVRLVTRHKPLLVQYIDLPSLWPYLSSRNLLTSDEYLCLTNKWREGHRQDSVGELLAILQRKHPLWAIGLYEALEESTQQSADVHSGHEHIVQVLQKEMKEGAPRCAVATPDTLAQVCLQTMITLYIYTGFNVSQLHSEYTCKWSAD